MAAVLAELGGVHRLVGMLLYGSGLRLLECLTLRVKDLDLARTEIRLRTTKGEVPRDWCGGITSTSRRCSGR